MASVLFDVRRVLAFPSPARAQAIARSALIYDPPAISADVRMGNTSRDKRLCRAKCVEKKTYFISLHRIYRTYRETFSYTMFANPRSLPDSYSIIIFAIILENPRAHLNEHISNYS